MVMRRVSGGQYQHDCIGFGKFQLASDLPSPSQSANAPSL